MKKTFTLMLASLAAGAASAHAGHSTNSLFDGWLHFLEWEHLSGIVIVVAAAAVWGWLRSTRSDRQR